MIDEKELWRKAYTVYQKDARIIEKWVEAIKKDPIRALNIARRLTVAEVIPDTVTLGFSPQSLIAALAMNYPQGKVKVLTSPEVLRCTIPAAKHSHEALEIYREIGLIEVVAEVPMAPKEGLAPKDVVRLLREALLRMRPRILDISGGTQLVPLAASSINIKLSYTYPHGHYVKIYLIQ